jgi:hypothetical protein
MNFKRILLYFLITASITANIFADAVADAQANQKNTEVCFNAVIKYLNENPDQNGNRKKQVEKLIQLRSMIALNKAAYAFLKYRNADSQQQGIIKGKLKQNMEDFHKGTASAALNEAELESFMKMFMPIPNNPAAAADIDKQSQLLQKYVIPMSKSVHGNKTKYHVSALDTEILARVNVKASGDRNLLKYTIDQMQRHYGQRSLSANDDGAIKEKINDYAKMFSDELAARVLELAKSSDAIKQACGPLVSQATEDTCQACISEVFLSSVLPSSATIDKLDQDISNINLNITQARYLPFLGVAKAKATNVSCKIDGNDLVLSGTFTNFEGIDQSKSRWNVSVQDANGNPIGQSHKIERSNAQGNIKPGAKAWSLPQGNEGDSYTRNDIRIPLGSAASKVGYKIKFNQSDHIYAQLDITLKNGKKISNSNFDISNCTTATTRPTQGNTGEVSYKIVLDPNGDQSINAIEGVDIKLKVSIEKYQGSKRVNTAEEIRGTNLKIEIEGFEAGKGLTIKNGSADLGQELLFENTNTPQVIEIKSNKNDKKFREWIGITRTKTEIEKAEDNKAITFKFTKKSGLNELAAAEGILKIYYVPATTQADTSEDDDKEKKWKYKTKSKDKHVEIKMITNIEDCRMRTCKKVDGEKQCENVESKEHSFERDKEKDYYVYLQCLKPGEDDKWEDKGKVLVGQCSAAACFQDDNEDEENNPNFRVPPMNPIQAPQNIPIPDMPILFES